MATKRVRMFEFVVPSPALQEREAAINAELRERFPGAGPVRLLATENGEIAVKMTMVVSPGGKALLDEVYRFVMTRIGESRGRKPGEQRVQVKYHLPAELHQRVKDAARKARVSASDLVAAYLKERLE